MGRSKSSCGTIVKVIKLPNTYTAPIVLPKRRAKPIDLDIPPILRDDVTETVKLPARPTGVTPPARFQSPSRKRVASILSKYIPDLISDTETTHKPGPFSHSNNPPDASITTRYTNEARTIGGMSRISEHEEDSRQTPVRNGIISDSVDYSASMPSNTLNTMNTALNRIEPPKPPILAAPPTPFKQPPNLPNPPKLPNPVKQLQPPIQAEPPTPFNQQLIPTEPSKPPCQLSKPIKAFHRQKKSHYPRQRTRTSATGRKKPTYVKRRITDYIVQDQIPSSPTPEHRTIHITNMLPYCSISEDIDSEYSMKNLDMRDKIELFTNDGNIRVCQCIPNDMGSS